MCTLETRSDPQSRRQTRIPLPTVDTANTRLTLVQQKREKMLMSICTQGKLSDELLDTSGSNDYLNGFENAAIYSIFQ